MPTGHKRSLESLLCSYVENGDLRNALELLKEQQTDPPSKLSLSTLMWIVRKERIIHDIQILKTCMQLISASSAVAERDRIACLASIYRRSNHESTCADVLIDALHSLMDRMTIGEYRRVLDGVLRDTESAVQLRIAVGDMSSNGNASAMNLAIRMHASNACLTDALNMIGQCKKDNVPLKESTLQYVLQKAVKQRDSAVVLRRLASVCPEEYAPLVYQNLFQHCLRAVDIHTANSCLRQITDEMLLTNANLLKTVLTTFVRLKPKSRWIQSPETMASVWSGSETIEMASELLSVLFAHEDVNQTNLAVTWFNHYVNVLGKKPHMQTINSMMLMFARHRDFVGTDRMFRLLTQFYYSPDAKSYTAMLKMCTIFGKMDRSMELLEEAMKRDDLEPTQLCFAVLYTLIYHLNVFPKKQDSINTVPHIGSPSELINGDEEPKDLLRNFCNALITRRVVKPHIIVKWLSRLEGLDKQIVLTFNLFIQNYLNVGDIEKALECLQMMIELGLKPNSYIVVSFLKCYRRVGKGDELNDWLSKSRILQWQWGDYAYAELMSLFCHLEYPLETIDAVAYQFASSETNNADRLNNAMFTNVMHAYRKCNDFFSVQHLWKYKKTETLSLSRGCRQIPSIRKSWNAQLTVYLDSFLACAFGWSDASKRELGRAIMLEATQMNQMYSLPFDTPVWNRLATVAALCGLEGEFVKVLAAAIDRWEELQLDAWNSRNQSNATTEASITEDETYVKTWGAKRSIVHAETSFVTTAPFYTILRSFQSKAVVPMQDIEYLKQLSTRLNSLNAYRGFNDLMLQFKCIE